MTIKGVYGNPLAQWLTNSVVEPPNEAALAAATPREIAAALILASQTSGGGSLETRKARVEAMHATLLVRLDTEAATRAEEAATMARKQSQQLEDLERAARDLEASGIAAAERIGRRQIILAVAQVVLGVAQVVLAVAQFSNFFERETVQVTPAAAAGDLEPADPGPRTEPVQPELADDGHVNAPGEYAEPTAGGVPTPLPATDPPQTAPAARAPVAPD